MNLASLDLIYQSIAGSVKESFSKNLSIQCAYCKQPFLGNVGKGKLEEHVGTHDKAKKTFSDCFPTFEQSE